jgi:hypothetical protein
MILKKYPELCDYLKNKHNLKDIDAALQDDDEINFDVLIN